MKLALLTIVLMMTIALNAQTKHPNRKNSVPVAPVSNAASTGGATMSGASDKPVGANEMEAEEARARASSMGGAPNAGGGMGTGTGAGSKVGKPAD